MLAPISPPDARLQHGFTLIELMVTLAVVAILIIIAAPSVRDAWMGVRMSAQANDLMADLALARSEAIKRGVPVRLCPVADAGTGLPNYTACSGTDWRFGWIVFVDDDLDGTIEASDNNGLRDNNELVLKTRPPTVEATSTITLVPAATNLGYRPTGVVNTGLVAAANTPTFTMCDSRTAANRHRKIAISPTGRAVATRCTCPCP